MKVTYLIDSENVGDFWIPLLDLPAEEAELVVFYTRNSPHMSYESLIRLKESDRLVTFIKCYEGTNALDFQLVSEMGYRIARGDSENFVIVTNDTGYDAAVKYWKHRKVAVKRITGKECRYIDRRARERDTETGAETQGSFETEPAEKSLPAVVQELPGKPAPPAECAEKTVMQPEETVQEQAEESTEPEETVVPAALAPAEEVPAAPAAEPLPEAEEAVPAAEPAADNEEPEAEVPELLPGEEPEEPVPAGGLTEKELLEVEMIVSCIGPENLAEIHNQLAILFGEHGKEIYQGLKSGEITVTPQKGETVEKYQVYGQLIFSRSDEEFPEDLPQFLLENKAKMKNLNSLRYALQKHYGKDKGHRTYYVLKPFVKVLNQM